MVHIYALTCKINGWMYVGCTAGKLPKRMRDHRSLLLLGQHKVKRLQADWDRFDRWAFEIKSLEELPETATVSEKREAELKWLRQIKETGLLYNEHIVSFSPIPSAIAKGIEASRGVIGNRWTPEANEKRRLAQLGKPKGHGAKISATKRANRLAKLGLSDEIV